MPNSGLQGKPWQSVEEAVDFLESHGYGFTPWYVIRPPAGKKDLIHATELEYRAVMYLVHEWDFEYKEQENDV